MLRQQHDDEAREEREALLQSYQVVSRMAAAENNVWWQRFNTFLYSSSLLLAVCGLSVTVLPPTPAKLFVSFVAAFGAAIGWIWFVMTGKILDYHALWEDAAHRIEDRLALPIRVFHESTKIKAGTKRLSRLLAAAFFVLFLAILVGVWIAPDLGAHTQPMIDAASGGR